MRIGDVCTHDVVYIGPDASLREAAEAMRKYHVGSIVVISRPNREIVPIGIITDRDIVLAVIAPGVSLDALTVGDVMTSSVATCAEDQDLFDAIEIMRERGIRRLPVLNAKGGLAGMIAADDIYGALGMFMRELSRALVREQVHEMEVRT